MKKLYLLFSLLLAFKFSFSQTICNPAGNVILFSNYDGGVLNINVDVNIPNLKIGVVSYEMVTINVSGPFVNNITEIQFAGYVTTAHQHCANSPSVTSIVGAPPGTDTLVFTPNSPVSNPNGYYIIICNYSCDTATGQGGCNTPDQIAAYFQQEFGGTLRYHYTQYGCWNGTYDISAGGNCCVAASVALPVALFTAPHQICPGTCTDFTNNSSNATSYLWTFPGGTPSTSTNVNPNICYSTPGNYDVTLVATNANGSDSVTLPNYINVFPYSPGQSIIQSGDTLFSNSGFSSYQWFYEGDTITGATDYFYVAMQSGNYSVICLDSNGCSVEAVLLNVLAGIHHDSLYNQQPIVVYPNPVVDELGVRSRDPDSYREGVTAHALSIFNILGETVFSAVDCLLSTVDCRLLSNGIYLLEITSDKKIYRCCPKVS